MRAAASRLMVEWRAPAQRGDAHCRPDSLSRASAPLSSCASSGDIIDADPLPILARRRCTPRSRRVCRTHASNGEGAGRFGEESHSRRDLAMRSATSRHCYRGGSDPSHRRLPPPSSPLPLCHLRFTMLMERGRKVLARCQPQRKGSLPLSLFLIVIMCRDACPAGAPPSTIHERINWQYLRSEYNIFHRDKFTRLVLGTLFVSKTDNTYSHIWQTLVKSTNKQLQYL